MEDDKIRQIFANYNPTPEKSVDDFMADLERNINAAEIVKEQIARSAQRTRRAACLSALTGFVTGVVATLITLMIGTFKISIPYIGVNLDSSSITWVGIATVTTLSALSVYSYASGKTMSSSGA